MPNQTKNLGLNTWLENEIVDFEQVNENFEKLDGMAMVIESGTKTASYTGGVNGTAAWRYKKYSDGTIEMSTKLEFTNIKCNGGEQAPYYSGASNVYFPFEFSSVYDVNVHMSSNTIGWASDITNRSVLDHISFRIMSMYKETENVYKQIFINVKGMVNNG